MKDLILLHGAIGSSTQLEPLKQQLGESFRVHSFNFSGHGGNAFAKDFSIAQFVADLQEYISDKNLENCNVFGYSMGGYVALFHALHYPGKIARIMTLATKFQWDEATALKEMKMLNPEKIEEKIPAFAEMLKARHAPIDWKSILHKTAEMMQIMGEKNPITADDFRKIDIPVRISVGDSDLMVSLEESISVYRELINGSLLVIPGMQHPVEKADVNRLKHEIGIFFNERNE